MSSLALVNRTLQRCSKWDLREQQILIEAEVVHPPEQTRQRKMKD
jgi:hypothetical protein